MTKDKHPERIIAICFLVLGGLLPGIAIVAHAESTVHAIGVIGGVRSKPYLRGQKRIFAQDRIEHRNIRREFPDKNSKEWTEASLAYNERRDDALARLSKRYPGVVRVTVDTGPNPVTLVLTSLEAVTWDVVPAPGANIDRVLVSAAQKQTIKDQSALGDAAVQYYPGVYDGRWFGFSDDDRQRVYYPKYDENRQEWICSDEFDETQVSVLLESIWVIENITGSEPTSMQGAEIGSTFAIRSQSTGIAVAKRRGPYCFADDIGLTVEEAYARQ